MTWVPTRPNLLPVDPVTGGQARLHAWYDTTGALTSAPDTGIYTMPRDSWITTGVVTGGVAVPHIPASPGRAYTAAVTADGFVVVTLMWIGADGVIAAGPSAPGSGRVAVTGVAPVGATGVIVEIDAPTARVTSDNGITYTISYWSRVQLSAYLVAADPTHLSSTVHLSTVALVAAASDPGDVTPTVLDMSIGKRIYDLLPQCYRDDDSGLLKAWLKAAGTPFDSAQTIADTVTAGTLTDPVAAPDAWVPWLAQTLGVQVTTLDRTRQLLAAAQSAPPAGTRGALAAVAQQYLTGSRIADVYPGPDSIWQILVRVRADQLGPVGFSTANLTAAIEATGQVPAGCYITVVEGTPTWAQVKAAIGPWSDVKTTGGRWADVMSIGVT